jgi:hypothetical protein
MIDTHIPAYTDAELQNLHLNAVRLSHSGTEPQKLEATRLLPIIAAEVETRRQARQARLAEARAQRRPARKPAARPH